MIFRYQIYHDSLSMKLNFLNALYLVSSIPRVYNEVQTTLLCFFFEFN